MKTGDIAAAVGKGLIAGAVGTAALTVSTLLAQKLAGQEPSSAPADATDKLLGVEPKGEQEKQRLTTVVHWLYGSSWGVPRGLFGLAGLRGLKATVAHFASVWGSEMVMLPRMKLAPPVTRWGKKELALDAVHHLVYAGAASAAFRFLDRRTSRTTVESADLPAAA
jgi:hypothetical protein